MYMLSLLSHEPQTGYSIMQTIYERTNGTWRPGPGTIYPQLRRLAKDGLAKPTEQSNDSTRTPYSLTEKGKSELQEMQKMLSARGTEGQAMLSVFSDLLPNSYYVPFFLKHFDVEMETFFYKVSQLPSDQKIAVLKEMDAMLERQLARMRSHALDRGRTLLP